MQDTIFFLLLLAFKKDATVLKQKVCTCTFKLMSNFNFVLQYCCLNISFLFRVFTLRTTCNHASFTLI